MEDSDEEEAGAQLSKLPISHEVILEGHRKAI